MTDRLTENRADDLKPDPRLRAWQLAVKLLGQSAEMQTRLIAFSPAELKQMSDQFPLYDIMKDPLKNLQRLHLQQARPDRNRVHPSWFKALEAKQISPVRRVLRAEPDAAHGSLRSIMLEAANTLSAERLVGDCDAWMDHSEIAHFFEDENPIGWLRLLSWTGRLRRWVAGELESFCGLPAYAKLRSSDSWPEMARNSLDQLRAAAKGKPLRASRYGLISLAMLAGQVDTRRRQWILQHLPMSVGALIAPLLRTEKKPLDENEMQFETWLATWAIGFEDDGMKHFLADFQGNQAGLSVESSLVEADSASPLNFETNDMEIMQNSDDVFDILPDSSEEEIPLPEDLFELDDSIEIVKMKSDHSGIFDPEIDQLVIEDSGEIEINDGHDEIVIGDLEDDDDSSFHIGDLDL